MPTTKQEEGGAGEAPATATQEEVETVSAIMMRFLQANKLALDGVPPKEIPFDLALAAMIGSIRSAKQIAAQLASTTQEREEARQALTDLQQGVGASFQRLVLPLNLGSWFHNSEGQTRIAERRYMREKLSQEAQALGIDFAIQRCPICDYPTTGLCEYHSDTWPPRAAPTPPPTTEESPKS